MIKKSLQSKDSFTLALCDKVFGWIAVSLLVLCPLMSDYYWPRTFVVTLIAMFNCNQFSSSPLECVLTHIANRGFFYFKRFVSCADTEPNELGVECAWPVMVNIRSEGTKHFETIVTWLSDQILYDLNTNLCLNIVQISSSRS